jgi:hypothetical protein
LHEWHISFWNRKEKEIEEEKIRNQAKRAGDAEKRECNQKKKDQVSRMLV